MKRIEVRKRERDALELRIAGHDFETIGEMVGLSEDGARRAVDRSIDRITAAAAERVRDLELLRLDSMWLVVWSFVTDEELSADERLRAIDRALKIAERRARYVGLDEPVKLDIRAMVLQVAVEFGLTDDEAAELHNDIQRELTAARLQAGDGR
jgi:hypothetical protein